MKILNILKIAVLSLVFLQTEAQTDVPKGFTNGWIVLADGSRYTGLVKDNIRKNSSITFITGSEKKKSYDGNELLAVEIEGAKFICIKGDFFKVHCEGELSFLQKSSDASGKVSYNGSEAILSSGTYGNINDYFIYNSNDKQLKLVSKKNVQELAATSFADCTAAINKAKTINGDLSQIRGAVEEYNNRNK